MQNFRDLKVWQKSHALTLALYRATARFPKEEMFGLTSQIRRSSASIPANISEACGRDAGADMARFLQMALGSASELEYHLLLARDLGFISDTEYQGLAKDSTALLTSSQDATPAAGGPPRRPAAARGALRASLFSQGLRPGLFSFAPHGAPQIHPESRPEASGPRDFSEGSEQSQIRSR